MSNESSPIHPPRRATCASLALALAIAGCTTQRNPRYCGDGVCIDPAYPFCDVDGMFGDLKQQCVAVSCTPDDFVTCRGDDELRCNAAGTSYDVTRCTLGCDASGGCRLCEPNQTTCTNGKVATCDAAGNVISSEVCPLGCFEDQPRCRDIIPSNNLGKYLDMVPSPPDVDLKNCTFNTGTGEVTTHGLGVPVDVEVPSFSEANGTGPSGFRVFVVNNVHLEDCTATSSNNSLGISHPPFAIAARGKIVIAGRLTADGRAGGLSYVACASGTGGAGRYTEAGGIPISSGSGGGGHATAGGQGGGVVGVFDGGTGGTVSGTETLIPLRGGCPSGPVMDGTSIVLDGSRGGGAIQLSSRVGIEIDGIIDVRGEYGYADRAGQFGGASFGGGAGGGLLLEAPSVVLGPNAKLMAKGAGGGALGPYQLNDDTPAPAPGAVCIDPRCSSGGNGASPGFEATAAANVARPGDVGYAGAGSGGGGMGRIRINTVTGVYTKASTAIEVGALSTGILATR